MNDRKPQRGQGASMFIFGLSTVSALTITALYQISLSMNERQVRALNEDLAFYAGEVALTVGYLRDQSTTPSTVGTSPIKLDNQLDTVAASSKNTGTKNTVGDPVTLAITRTADLGAKDRISRYDGSNLSYVFSTNASTETHCGALTLENGRTIRPICLTTAASTPAPTPPAGPVCTAAPPLSYTAPLPPGCGLNPRRAKTPIRTQADLEKIVASGSYQLMNDITVTPPLKAISLSHSILDGGGFSISGMTSGLSGVSCSLIQNLIISNPQIHGIPSNTYRSLFYQLTNSTLDNVSVVGGIIEGAGWFESASGTNVLANCKNAATVLSSYPGSRSTAAFIGYAAGGNLDSVTIVNSINTGTILESRGCGIIGGFVAEAGSIAAAQMVAPASSYQGTTYIGTIYGGGNVNILNSVNCGEIKRDATYPAPFACERATASSVGGFIGKTGLININIQDSANYGNITGYNGGNSGTGTGGFIGTTNGPLTMKNVTNYGQVATMIYGGGIVGHIWANPVNIQLAVNSGNIINGSGIVGALSPGNFPAPMLADPNTAGQGGGVGNGKILNVTNTGTITGSEVGGLIGQAYGGTDELVQAKSPAGYTWSRVPGGGNFTISGNNSGDVSGSGYAGGLVGLAASSAGSKVFISGTNSGKVTEIVYPSSTYVGGIIGIASPKGVTISNATNSGAVKGINGFAGGLVGALSGGITNSQNSGAVAGHCGSTSGIAGTSGTIIIPASVTNTGRVTCK